MFQVAVIIAAPLLLGLLLGESRENRVICFAFKTPLSCLFVICALLQPHPDPFYSYFVIGGLVFGLIGDVCLVLPGLLLGFFAGLIAFFVGHLLYIVAFAHVAEFAAWLSPVPIMFCGISALVFWWLRPWLGPFYFPVLLYAIVISIMVSLSWLGFVNLAVHPTGALALFAGSTSFYFSDLFVARDRFVKKKFVNRLIGLPLYYIGQFLLAFSVGWVGRAT